jgi:hypothetical protein
VVRKIAGRKTKKVVSSIFCRLRADDDGLVFNLINMKRARKRGVLLLLS